MKIAMFADSFRPTVDGAIVAMETAAAGLEKRGHQVVFLAPDQGVKPETKWLVHYLPSRVYKPYPGYRYAISPSDMLEFLRREKPDVIHSHGIASMGILSLTAARALRIPHVLTFHTMANEAVKYYLPLNVRQDIVEELVWVYLRNLMKRSEVVIVPSSPIKKELIENGVSMKECEVVPTGVDCSRFSPDRYDKNYLKKYGLDGKRVILHVGRLSKEKRLDIVLGALAQLSKGEPDLRLLVAGHGPAADDYRKMAKDLGIADKVVFAGFLPDEELPIAYASCEIMVIASTFETQGIVVLESLASGTPVAGIRYRAIPEFIEEGKNGCLFDADNCAEAIQRCLLRSDSMMINAVSSARKYSVEACITKLEDAYQLAERTLKKNA